MTFKYSNRWIASILLLIIIVGGIFAWRHFKQPAVPDAFASGNGRIEATEVNVATKLSGRLSELLVREGDDVTIGQVVARMDTAALEADLREAEAQIRQANQKAKIAAAVVAQRQNEKKIATAMVAQRQNAKLSASALATQRDSQLSLADKEVQRTEQLIKKGFISPQKLDVDQTARQTAAASVSAAKSQVMEVQSAIDAARASEMQAQSFIDAARAGEMEAQSAIEAAEAKVEKIKADIKDATLTSPINGRVLYRLVEPGEVLGAGGNVLTLLDITDVYMTIFLHTSQAGRVSIDTDARIVLDVRPDISIPARVTFVSPEAQFTPKSVETHTEREKLMFRIKVKIPQKLLKAYAKRVKTGLPGVAYVRLDHNAPWPDTLPPLVGDNNVQ